MNNKLAPQDLDPARFATHRMVVRENVEIAFNRDLLNFDGREPVRKIEL